MEGSSSGEEELVIPETQVPDPPASSSSIAGVAAAPSATSAKFPFVTAAPPSALQNSLREAGLDVALIAGILQQHHAQVPTLWGAAAVGSTEGGAGSNGGDGVGEDGFGSAGSGGDA